MKKRYPRLLLFFSFFVFIYTLKEDELTQQILAGTAFLLVLGLSIYTFRASLQNKNNHDE